MLESSDDNAVTIGGFRPTTCFPIDPALRFGLLVPRIVGSMQVARGQRFVRQIVSNVTQIHGLVSQ